MMGQVSALETRKSVNKPDQRVTIKRADQHAAGRPGRDQMRKRYDIQFRPAPNLFLLVLCTFSLA